MNSTKNRLAEYIHNKYNVEDITFREINVVFIEGFYLFIRGELSVYPQYSHESLYSVSELLFCLPTTWD